MRNFKIWLLRTLFSTVEMEEEIKWRRKTKQFENSPPYAGKTFIAHMGGGCSRVKPTITNRLANLLS